MYSTLYIRSPQICNTGWALVIIDQLNVQPEVNAELVILITLQYIHQALFF